MTSLANNEDEYVPPKVWKVDGENGGKFASINSPTAGARETKELPKGKHPLQLYSLGTPNGQKVTIFLEEMLLLGNKEAEYDAWLINIGEGDQFGSDFVDLNPNSKIPALLDTTTDTRMFESGSILLQLSEKFDNAFLPKEMRSEVLNWLFWQMGSAPYVGGGFGHFYAYAPYKMKYPIDRFTMETKRQLDVLEKQLIKTNKFIAGDQYTLADIAIWPWYGSLVLGNVYPNSEVFLNCEEDYPNVLRWAKEVMARPAVNRGKRVNKSWGEEGENLKERHDASDFDALTNL
ncbi:unnamed protein product [Cylindrotheca closterium]|uniref:Glutathione-dependent disulfide-bond oxidoreductase n=1 Tax=Cylindrotheca closterium TaxID=2856 RepID=A0AAD2FDR1_9STRA|nr:unnamed protein product [Cylindrotheca closterium]